MHPAQCTHSSQTFIKFRMQTEKNNLKLSTELASINNASGPVRHSVRPDMLRRQKLQR